ncbi:hypothetical protein M8J76_006681 [Diaphorina citri]|nr:hypothetical protein M8J76_006681 [Diaphorina citri]
MIVPFAYCQDKRQCEAARFECLATSASGQANAERRKLQTQMLDASTRTTQMTQIRKVVNMLRQMQRGTDYSNSSLRGAFEHCRLPTSSPLTSISATRAARSEHPRYTQSEHAS